MPSDRSWAKKVSNLNTKFEFFFFENLFHLDHFRLFALDKIYFLVFDLIWPRWHHDELN